MHCSCHTRDSSTQLKKCFQFWIESDIWRVFEAISGSLVREDNFGAGHAAEMPDPSMGLPWELDILAGSGVTIWLCCPRGLSYL
jgi:hypothetical protein